MAYDAIAERFEKLERRNLAYRFDLERDVAWARVSEPGLYFPWSFIADFAVPVERLLAHAGAASLFQWSYALSMCEAFVALEDMILTFVDVEGDRVPATRSLGLLCEEERKHVALFQRLGAALRAQRPDDVAAFDRAYAPSRAWLADVGTLTADAGDEKRSFQHYMFWLLTTFFEEFTIFLDDKLREDASIQPTWASAHSAHRREETQHVVTDLAYLDVFRIDPESRGEWSAIFVAGLARGVPRFTAYEAAVAMVEATFPELGSLAPTAPVTSTRFFRSVCEASQFRRTREHAPALVRQEREKK